MTLEAPRDLLGVLDPGITAFLPIAAVAGRPRRGPRGGPARCPRPCWPARSATWPPWPGGGAGGCPASRAERGRTGGCAEPDRGTGLFFSRDRQLVEPAHPAGRGRRPTHLLTIRDIELPPTPTPRRRCWPRRSGSPPARPATRRARRPMPASLLDPVEDWPRPTARCWPGSPSSSARCWPAPTSPAPTARSQVPWGSHPDLDPHWSSEDLRARVPPGRPGPHREGRHRRTSPQPALDALLVCWEGAAAPRNCGRCPKCLRTMTAASTSACLDRCRPSTRRSPSRPCATRRPRLAPTSSASCSPSSPPASCGPRESHLPSDVPGRRLVTPPTVAMAGQNRSRVNAAGRIGERADPADGGPALVLGWEPGMVPLRPQAGTHRAVPGPIATHPTARSHGWSPTCPTSSAQRPVAGAVAERAQRCGARPLLPRRHRLGRSDRAGPRTGGGRPDARGGPHPAMVEPRRHPRPATRGRERRARLPPAPGDAAPPRGRAATCGSPCWRGSSPTSKGWRAIDPDHRRPLARRRRRDRAGRIGRAGPRARGGRRSGQPCLRSEAGPPAGPATCRSGQGRAVAHRVAAPPTRRRSTKRLRATTRAAGRDGRPSTGWAPARPARAGHRRSTPVSARSAARWPGTRRCSTGSRPPRPGTPSWPPPRRGRPGGGHRPGLSVFTICWNHADLLPAAIASGLALLDHLDEAHRGEVLVLDDGSSGRVRRGRRRVGCRDGRVRCSAPEPRPRPRPQRAAPHGRHHPCLPARRRQHRGGRGGHGGLRGRPALRGRLHLRDGGEGRPLEAAPSGSSRTSRSPEPWVRSNYIDTMAVVDVVLLRRLGGWPRTRSSSTSTTGPSCTASPAPESSSASCP